MSSSAKSSSLIIFDVDGTLLDANTFDYACFDHAFQATTGKKLTASEWATFTEVTAQAIVFQALGKDWPDLSSVEVRIRDAYLAKLREGQGLDPASLRAFTGTLGLISTLKNGSDFQVAIATGCWRETAHFKLTTAGFDLAGIPFACASDRYSRAEIISLAAERAGVPLDEAVYVGDGIWDFRATQQLGIPFIGTGRKVGALRQAGARHTVDDLNHGSLLQAIKLIREDGVR